MFDNRQNAKELDNPIEADENIGFIILTLPYKFNTDLDFKKIWEERKIGNSAKEIMALFTNQERVTDPLGTVDQHLN